MNSLHVDPLSVFHSVSQDFGVVIMEHLGYAFMVVDDPPVELDHVDFVVDSLMVDAAIEEFRIFIPIFKPCNFCPLLDEGGVSFVAVRSFCALSFSILANCGS